MKYSIKLAIGTAVAAIAVITGSFAYHANKTKALRAYATVGQVNVMSKAVTTLKVYELDKQLSQDAKFDEVMDLLVKHKVVKERINPYGGDTFSFKRDNNIIMYVSLDNVSQSTCEQIQKNEMGEYISESNSFEDALKKLKHPGVAFCTKHNGILSIFQRA